MLAIRLYLSAFCLLLFLTQTQLQTTSLLPTTTTTTTTTTTNATITTSTTNANSTVFPSTNATTTTTTTTNATISSNSSISSTGMSAVGAPMTSLSASNFSTVSPTVGNSTNQIPGTSSQAPMASTTAFQTPADVSTQATVLLAVQSPSDAPSTTDVPTQSAAPSTTDVPSSTATPATTTQRTTEDPAAAIGTEVVAVAVTMSLIIIVLILLLALVLVFGLWYTRRKSSVPWYMALIGRSPSQQEEHAREKPRGIRKSMMLGSQMINIDGGTQQDLMPFLNETLRRRLQPISVENLPDQVRKMHQLSNQGFRLEYESLEMAPQATFQTALLEENRHKNRYRNILPYDHSRVRLLQLAGKESSDYINADYIDAYREPNKFIAAQGPLLETMDDFWRMVWELRSQNLVMLTNLKEYDILGNERNKCEKYWPDEVGSELKLGLMSVRLTKVTQLSDYIIREMTLSTAAGGTPLEVLQFHFIVWPDHGVPQFATSLIAFIRAVERCQLRETAGPHVVHCSAGVGRTGTYITLNSMLERINLENNVNVYEFVRLMRAKRNYMVQTEEQYVFIHDALVELVTSGDTSIPSDLAIATINSYKEPEGDSYKGKAMSTISKQFLLLREYSRQPTEDSCSFAVSEENRGKNRFEDKIPYDDYRVRITPGTDNTDYINASFVDGYKQKRAYIATQSPTAGTAGDFWQMVYEKESAVIVMLCGLHDNGEESCYQYWPAPGGELVFRRYRVKNVEERHEEGFVRRKLQIVFSFHNKLLGSTVTAERKVVQLCLERWPSSTHPQELTPFLTIIDAVERIQAANQNPPITVHCKDGSGRTGTFLTMFSVLEKLKPEHLVDVFQILKKARIQRPLLVETEEQYEMCYNFVFCYLDSFDAYANFCVKSSENYRLAESESDTEANGVDTAVGSSSVT